MNKEQVGGLVRTITLGATTYAAGKGWIGAGQAADLAGVLATFLIGSWSVYAKRDK